MDTKAMPNVLSNQAVPNVLSGIPLAPLPVRPALPRGFVPVVLVGVVAALVALLGGGS